MKRLKSSFLDKVIAVARRYCGDDFIKKFNQIVKEREENFILDLKEAKNKIEVEPEVQEEIVNELKFDTLLSLSAEYLEQYKFIQMCFDIGDVCLTYGEFDKAENCFLLVIKKAGKTRELKIPMFKLDDTKYSISIRNALPISNFIEYIKRARHICSCKWEIFDPNISISLAKVSKGKHIAVLKLLRKFNAFIKFFNSSIIFAFMNQGYPDVVICLGKS